MPLKVAKPVSWSSPSPTMKDRNRKNANRNNRNQRSAPSVESEDDSNTCDAILVTCSEHGEEATMKADAKQALNQALQEEELHVEDVNGSLWVGNRRGLDLASLPHRVRVLEAQITEIPLLKLRVTSLEDRVSSLTNSLASYRLLRNRFISTFKRDKLGNATDIDRQNIETGNSEVHGGDAKADAMLYEGVDGRRDFSAFKKLYGLLPETVQRITHNETITILNHYASVTASNRHDCSEEFYKRYAKFIELFEESDYDDGYLQGAPTEVTRAYWSFQDCLKDGVIRVDAPGASS